MDIFMWLKNYLEKKALKFEEKKIINISKFFSFLVVRKYIDKDLSRENKLKADAMLCFKIFFRKSRTVFRFNYFLDHDFAVKLQPFFAEVNYNNEIFDLKGQLKLFLEIYPEYFTEKEIIKLNYVFDSIVKDYPSVAYENLLRSIATGSNSTVALKSVQVYKRVFCKERKKEFINIFKYKLFILGVSAIIITQFV